MDVWNNEEKMEKSLYVQLDACKTIEEVIELYEKHKDELEAIHNRLKENAEEIRVLVVEKNALMERAPDYVSFKELVHERIGFIVMNNPPVLPDRDVTI